MVALLMPMSVYVALLAMPASMDAGEGPQPSATPTAWEFEFTFLDPRRIEVYRRGASTPDVYWYMVYTVRNPGRRALRFFPLFQIVTEDLRVVDTDMAIGLEVFDAIAERHKTLHKFLTPPTKAIGSLLSGDDNARESVAIWRDVDLTENDFSIFVAGLSGETQIVEMVPDKKKAEVIGQSSAESKPRFFTLRKTLEIQYTLPGSPEARRAAAPERGTVRWVMR
jgi:hypothetical protein